MSTILNFKTKEKVIEVKTLLSAMRIKTVYHRIIYIINRGNSCKSPVCVHNRNLSSSASSCFTFLLEYFHKKFNIANSCLLHIIVSLELFNPR